MPEFARWRSARALSLRGPAVPARRSTISADAVGSGFAFGKGVGHELGRQPRAQFSSVPPDPDAISFSFLPSTTPIVSTFPTDLPPTSGFEHVHNF
jgi:hypothetical protein